MEDEHRPVVLELGDVRGDTGLLLKLLLSVEGLEGSFSSLDLEFGIVDHEELLASVEGSLINLGFLAPRGESIECLPEDGLLVVHFERH